MDERFRIPDDQRGRFILPEALETMVNHERKFRALLVGHVGPGPYERAAMGESPSPLAAAEDVGVAKLRQPAEAEKNRLARTHLEILDRDALREKYGPAPPSPVCLSVPLIDAPGELRFMAALAKLAEQFERIPGVPTQPSQSIPSDEFERAIRWFASKYAPERPF